MHTQISHMDSHWPELRFAPFQFNIDLNAVSSKLSTFIFNVSTFTFIRK
jgi:hypothetical protein